MNWQMANIPILIGTHAVIEDTVQFKNLGLAIIDEQHRFGVAQRARLWKKSRDSSACIGDDGDAYSKNTGDDGLWRS